MRKSFDTTKITKDELIRQLEAADREFGSQHSTRWDGETMIVEWPYKRISGGTVSAIDRIKAKALQARGIAPKAIADFERDLDSLIAEGPKLESERAAAVSVHHEAFSGIRGEIGGLRDAMDILSNGGPPLDESKNSVGS